jgi:hypothetical protein
MRTRFGYLMIVFVFLLIGLIAGAGLSNAAAKKQLTMEEMTLRLEMMEKRLTEIEDIEKIKQVQIKYVNCLTFGKYEEDFFDLFTDDAVADVFDGSAVATGKEQLKKLFLGPIASVHKGKEGNYVVHPLITVDGDRAKGNWLVYLQFVYPTNNMPLFWVQGVYDCEYAKTNGKWQISHMKFRMRLAPEGGPPIFQESAGAPAKIE